ncbi:hypothetical protein [Brevibacillus brevis]|uniref:hypothetical protein n=1 Tax=Brevibacillus brevis TaxID=1393 RepID=UPI0025A50932|nr:hypothetical protein [Brevibacillus brevis]WJQ82551.1 hypothetical protein QN310_05225 [Brevibacillus brevis]
MKSRYLDFAVILTGVLLYRIFWGDSLTPGVIGILVGLIIVSLILFMRKQYAQR